MGLKNISVRESVSFHPIDAGLTTFTGVTFLAATYLNVPPRTNRMRYHKKIFCIQLKAKNDSGKILLTNFGPPVYR
jgi:hypothetical protein